MHIDIGLKVTESEQERRQQQGATTRALERFMKKEGSRREWTARLQLDSSLVDLFEVQSLARKLLLLNQLAASAAYWSDNNATNKEMPTIVHVSIVFAYWHNILDLTKHYIIIRIGGNKYFII